MHCETVKFTCYHMLRISKTQNQEVIYMVDILWIVLGLSRWKTI